MPSSKRGSIEAGASLALVSLRLWLRFRGRFGRTEQLGHRALELLTRFFSYSVFRFHADRVLR